MKLIDEEKFRATFVAKLHQWVETLPEPEAEEPIVGVAGGETLSPKDIVRHVERRTPRGEMILNQWVSMAFNQAVDHILGAELK